MGPIPSANLGLLPQGTRFPLLQVAFSTLSLFETGWDGKGGLKGWQQHQLDHQDQAMAPGPALPFCQKLLGLNPHSPDPVQRPLVQVHVVSRQNHAVSLRFLKSIEHHGLQEQIGGGIHQVSYLNGASPVEMLLALGAHLFLSTNRRSVRQSLKSGVPAAHLLPDPSPAERPTEGRLTLAFDGDALIFDDEGERIFQEKGLVAFMEHERARAGIPLGIGPLYGFLIAAGLVRSLFSEPPDDPPLELVLVTTRGTATQERVTRTLQRWNVRFDRAHFLRGRDKGPILRATGATIFFDDSLSNVESARRQGIATGHVPWGIKNE